MKLTFKHPVVHGGLIYGRGTGEVPDDKAQEILERAGPEIVEKFEEMMPKPMPVSAVPGTPQGSAVSQADQKVRRPLPPVDQE